MLVRLVKCSSSLPESCSNASYKPLCRLAPVTSQRKPSDILTLEIGTLAPFVEILALSSKILAPFGSVLDENGMHGSEALSVRLQLLDPCVISNSLCHADHSATMSCIRRHTQFHISSQ